MRQSATRIVFWSIAGLFAFPLFLALRDLPDFGAYAGPYGDLVLATCTAERHTPQGVAAVTFDYRGFDTLGEEFILFAALAGALLLMRPQEDERQHPPQDHALDRPVPAGNEAIAAAGRLMFPFSLMLSLYIIVHGHLTPGGGFQGGVLLATAFYYVYLSGEYQDLHPFTSIHLLESLKVLGAAGFALLAAAPLGVGLPFMTNLLPLGREGELLSAGTLPLCNLLVGCEVGAAFLLLIDAFLRQMVVIGKKKESS